MRFTKLLSSANPEKDKYIANHIYIYHSQMLNTKNEEDHLKRDRKKTLQIMGSAIRIIAAISSETMETQS